MPVGANPGALWSTPKSNHCQALDCQVPMLSYQGSRGPLTASSACLTLDVPQGLLFPGPERLFAWRAI